MKRLGISVGRNFYALRHTFETIGGDAKDQVAVDHIMGHARDDMASVYRERISVKDLTVFVKKRQPGKPSGPPRKRGKKDDGIIEYF